MSPFTQSFSKDPIHTLHPQNLPCYPFHMTYSRPTFFAPFSSSTVQPASINSPRPETKSFGCITSSTSRKRSRTVAEQENFSIETNNRPLIIPEQLAKHEKCLESADFGDFGLPNTDGNDTKCSIQKSRESLIESHLQIDCSSSNFLAHAKKRGSKSMRLGADTMTAVSDNRSHDEPKSPLALLPKNSYELLADKFTRELGVGWSSLSNANSDVQVAARGWVKFIENHFPITNVKIQLQSKGLTSYLVEASEGYFLFTEDLKQGRLVSADPEKVCINLQGPVPTFDGEVIMEASQSPNIFVESFPITQYKSCEHSAPVSTSSSEPHAIHTSSSTPETAILEMKMDIS